MLDIIPVREVTLCAGAERRTVSTMNENVVYRMAELAELRRQRQFHPARRRVDDRRARRQRDPMAHRPVPHGDDAA